jgi:hypothetical protein
VRVAVVDTYYPAFLERHYAERPELASAGYASQLGALMDRCFGTSDAYSEGFRSLGFEAVDLVVNCGPLQRRWADENGHRGAARPLASLVPGRAKARGERAFLVSTAMAQIAAFEPDVLYFQDLGWMPLAQLDELRGRGHLIAGQIASPAPGPDRLRRFDLILTSFPHFVNRFRAEGVRSEYLPIAFHEKVLERLRATGSDPSPGAERPYDLAFVGGLDPRIHPEGTALIERLCQDLDLQVWGYGVDALPEDSVIRRHYHGEAWGLDMYSVLAKTKVAINRHIDAAEGYSNNMRLYEATGVGAVLATEASINLEQLFKPMREVIAFHDPDELLGAVSRVLERDGERCRIASAGQRRTLSDHTYGQVIGELAGLLSRELRAA